MARHQSRLVLACAAVAAAFACLLLIVPPGAAQTPPLGPPASGPPPGFGGALVADPAFAGGGDQGGGDDGGGGGDDSGGGGTTTSEPTDKLRIVRGSLAGRVVKMRVICQVPGKVTLRTWPRRARLAAKRFSCVDGSEVVRLRLSRRDMRKLRAARMEAQVILAGGGERDRYRVTFARTARASANTYWTEAEGYCGLLTATGFKYRLNAPPIFVGVPGGGPDVGWVRYYWYRLGVGWVGDSGWSEPFDIPDEYPGAVFLGDGWEYLLQPDSHAWYAGAIAIWSRNANAGDWNWVYTYPRNAFNPVVGQTWCGTDP